MTVSMLITRLSSVITGCGGNETTCSRRSIRGFKRSAYWTTSAGAGSRGAWGMIRMPRDSVMSTTTATTMSTIRVATGRPSWVAYESLFGYQRGGAVDLEHLDPGAGLESLVLVERAGAPDLAADLHLTAATVHALEHHGGGADQRCGPGAQGQRRAQMAASNRPQHRERRGGHGYEDDPLERHPAAGQRDDRRCHGRDSHRPEEEPEREHLSHREQPRSDHPQDPLVHLPGC